MKSIRFVNFFSLIKEHCWASTFIICSILTLAFEYKPLEYGFSSIYNVFLPGSTNQKVYFYLSDIFACLGISFVLWPVRRFWKEIFGRPSALLLLAFFSLVCLSVLLSDIPFYGWQFFRLMNLGILILLSIVISSQYCFLNRKNLLLKTCTAIFLFSLYESTVALGQYILQAPLNVIGEVNFSELGEKASAFSINPQYSWIFDSFVPKRKMQSLIFRPYGSLPHPNILAGVLFIGFFASIYLRSLVEKPLIRFFLTFASIIQLVALFTTYSRTASLAWVLSFGVFLVCYLRLHGASRSRDQQIKFFVKVALSAIACSFFIYQQYSVRGFFSNSPNAKSAFQSKDIVDRLDNQSIAIKMIQDRPLLGTGFESYMLKATDYVSSSEDTVFPAHNIFLVLAVETGLISLFLLFGYFSSIIYLIYRHGFFHNTQQVILFAAFLGILFMGLCDFYLLIFQVGRVFLFIIPALIIRSYPKEISLLSHKSMDEIEA